MPKTTCPSDFRAYVERVRQDSDILEVIGAHVELSPKGMGRCPFHDDSTPSFSVSAERQVFHCFGCDISGDVFRFVERQEKLGFGEAVRLLAERAGIPPHQPSASDLEAVRARREVEDVLGETAAYYHGQLTPEARAYLTEKRGLPEEFLDRFQVGWADGSLRAHLQSKGISDAAGLRAGVLVEHEGRARDFFYGRVVFPVLRHGRVVFLTGRRIDEAKPPWLHLKGERPLLFNEEALRNPEVYVCEGVLDALALEKWDRPAVALLGTGAKHDELVKRMRRVVRVYLCLDGDDPGRGGTLALGRALGLKAKIVELPEGQDPNDLLVAGQREVFDRCVAEARDPITAQIEAIPADTDRVELPDRLAPVQEQLAGLDEAKAEAFLDGPIKERFGFKVKDLKPYRKDLEAQRKARGRRAKSGVAEAEGGAKPAAVGAKGGAKYSVHEHGTCHHKETREGPVDVLLANFRATITEYRIEDDGVEHRLLYLIEAEGKPGRQTVQVLATSFNSMGWLQELGPRWILEAGQSQRDHFRAAIQHLSPEPVRRVCYTHLGWREIEGVGWCYLTASGPIGPVGPVPGVEVRLDGALARYALSVPANAAETKKVVHATLRVLALAPDEVGMPLFAMVWRAVLGDADFSGFLAGQSGTRKTATAAVAQSFWGPDLDERHLPGSWSSTANYTEIQGFQAKDALLVVDDFAPTGSTADVQRYHREADRLLRGQGNLAGRGRLRRDGTPRPARPPRGLILSTGEDVPSGQSLRARTFILEIGPATIDLVVLTECQKAAREGIYARAMGAFVQWLAPHYPGVREALKASAPALRRLFQEGSPHGRTASIAAELLAGFDVWLVFAEAAGAITAEERAKLHERCLRALRAGMAAQASQVAASEPTRRFLELLGSAIASGEAYVADPKGEAPVQEGPEAWGWRGFTGGSVQQGEGGWRSVGQQVGWVAGQELYLDPTAALKAAQRMAVGSDGLAISEATLGKRLAERGLLRSREGKRGRVRVRVQLQGKRRAIWHLGVDTLSGETAQPAQPTQGAETEPLSRGIGPEPWVGLVEGGEETGPANRPTDGERSRQSESPGKDGPIGPVLERRGQAGAGNSPHPILEPCRACGGTRWWRGGRAWICGRCHPPAAGADRVVWAGEDGGEAA